jgi:hypothetical protein
MIKPAVKGYEADHKDIKLLRLRNFTISRKIGDSEITSADSLQMISNLIGSMFPFVSFCSILSSHLLFRSARKSFALRIDFYHLLAKWFGVGYRSRILIASLCRIVALQTLAMMKKTRMRSQTRIRVGK